MQARQVTAFGPPARFYECPRWRAGRWWVSDMRDGKVHSFSPEGEARVELVIDDRPGGLGWTPDGRMLVVSMNAKRLLQVAGGAVETAYDLAPVLGDTEGFCNDLGVSAVGHAYVGFDADHLKYPSDADLGRIARVGPDGQVALAAQGLAMPNGIVFTPDGAQLVVAETMRPRFSGFAIAPDGSLGERSDWGALDAQQLGRAIGAPAPWERPVNLDGCAMDAERHIWAADVSSGCIRVAPGGEVVDAVILPDGMRAFACGLGGPDGRTLLICGADDNFQDRASRISSQIFVTRVNAPAA
jgi:sugar lactone lactonase YvrE